MTIILAHVSKNHAFLATDSCRWDLVQNRNVGPVRKLHTADGPSAVAIGGMLIDRTELAAQLVTARNAGKQFAEAARSITPYLFQQMQQRMAANGLSGTQFVVSWYAEIVDAECQITRHRLPENISARVAGFDCMGPDTPWLSQTAQGCLSSFSINGRLALDAWAHHVIGLGAQRHPNSVSFPAKAVMLRPGADSVMRILESSSGSHPHPAFSI